MNVFIRYIRIIIGTILISLLAGMLLPMVFTGPGLDRFHGDSKIFGRYMIRQTDQAIGGTYEGFFITTYRISSLTKESSDDRHKCAYGPYEITGRFSGRMTLYTIFGLPYGEVLISCGGWDKVIRYWL